MQVYHKDQVLVELLDETEQKTSGGLYLPTAELIDNQVPPAKQGIVRKKGKDVSQVEVGEIVIFDTHEQAENEIDNHRFVKEERLYAKFKSDVKSEDGNRIIPTKDNCLPLNDLVLIERRKRNLMSGIIIRTDEKIYNKACDVIAVGPKTKELKGGETAVLLQYDGFCLDSLANSQLVVCQEKLIPGLIEGDLQEDLI